MEPTPPTTPFWFKQRQCKLEVAGTEEYRITGPNLRECFLGLRQLANGKYQGYFRLLKDGPDTVVTAREFDTTFDAWEAAFEIYREAMIV